MISTTCYIDFDCVAEDRHHVTTLLSILLWRKNLRDAAFDAGVERVPAKERYEIGLTGILAFVAVFIHDRDKSRRAADRLALTLTSETLL